MFGSKFLGHFAQRFVLWTIISRHRFCEITTITLQQKHCILRKMQGKVQKSLSLFFFLLSSFLEGTDASFFAALDATLATFFWGLSSGPSPGIKRNKKQLMTNLAMIKMLQLICFYLLELLKLGDVLSSFADSSFALSKISGSSSEETSEATTGGEKKSKANIINNAESNISSCDASLLSLERL